MLKYIFEVNSPPSPLLPREGRAGRCRISLNSAGEGEFGVAAEGENQVQRVLQHTLKHRVNVEHISMIN